MSANIHDTGQALAVLTECEAFYLVYRRTDEEGNERIDYMTNDPVVAAYLMAVGKKLYTDDHIATFERPGEEEEDEE